MITRNPNGVTTPVELRRADETHDPGISALDAHTLAGITYRQLDHWARQGWVRPSLDPGTGRSGRRQYSSDDVVRLDLLRHLAQSRVNAAVAGPQVAAFRVPDGNTRVLWGPVGSKEEGEPTLTALAAGQTLERLEAGGAYVVYNPAAVRARIAVLLGAGERLARPSAAQRMPA